MPIFTFFPQGDQAQSESPSARFVFRGRDYQQGARSVNIFENTFDTSRGPCIIGPIRRIRRIGPIKPASVDNRFLIG